jgi:hypothetical protein
MPLSPNAYAGHFDFADDCFLYEICFLEMHFFTSLNWWLTRTQERERGNIWEKVICFLWSECYTLMHRLTTWYVFVILSSVNYTRKWCNLLLLVWVFRIKYHNIGKGELKLYIYIICLCLHFKKKWFISLKDYIIHLFYF